VAMNLDAGTDDRMRERLRSRGRLAFHLGPWNRLIHTFLLRVRFVSLRLRGSRIPSVIRRTA
jgi:hypothetical protein